MQGAVLVKMIDFPRLTKALRKGGGSTCKADSTDPDMLKMRLFASIRRNLFSIDWEVNFFR